MSLPRSRHTTRDEIELAFLEFELAERHIGVRRQVFELVCDAVLLLMTVALAVVTIVCALRGSHWPVLTGTGGLAALGLRALTDNHRRRGRPR